MSISAVEAVEEMGLLSPAEIRERATPYRRPHFVYFLLDGEEIVYVGRSCYPRARLGAHRRTKTWDRAFCMEVGSRAAAGRLEARYIEELDPYYNGGSGGGTPMENDDVERANAKIREGDSLAAAEILATGRVWTDEERERFEAKHGAPEIPDLPMLEGET